MGSGASRIAVQRVRLVTDFIIEPGKPPQITCLRGMGRGRMHRRPAHTTRNQVD